VVEFVEGDAFGAAEAGGGYVEDLAVFARGEGDDLPYR
jgi:hypothetical protein